MSFLTKLRGDSAVLPPRASVKVIVLAFAGSFLAIAVLALMTRSLQQSLLLGSFGASAGLIFAFPDVPFSQPRNIVIGHLIITLIGLAFIHLCGAHWWSVALAVASAVSAMMITRTVHPPAASNPLIVFLAQPGWDFVLFPTLAGAVVLVLFALVFHNVTRRVRWPKYW